MMKMRVSKTSGQMICCLIEAKSKGNLGLHHSFKFCNEICEQISVAGVHIAAAQKPQHVTVKRPCHQLALDTSM